MSSEADLTQGGGSPDNIDLTQDGQKWPVVAEDWPVSPINPGDAAKEPGTEKSGSTSKDSSGTNSDQEQDPVRPEETNPKAVIRVFDDKELELTKNGGQPVFEEARELQRERVEHRRRE